MWQSHTEDIEDGTSQKIRISANDQILSFAEVLNHWQQDCSFRSFFNSVLVNATFEAFRWETPAITAATIDRDFEFVTLACPGLLTTPDFSAFDAQFQAAAAGEEVVAFPNLGKDAILVVPRPLQPGSAYGHLAAFVRTAPESQLHAWWRTVGKVTNERLNEKPVWLSTAGMGVPWLHVRLDDRPKYYGHRPYRNVN